MLRCLIDFDLAFEGWKCKMLQHFEVILSYYVPTYYYNMISKNFDKVSANSYPIYHTY